MAEATPEKPGSASEPPPSYGDEERVVAFQSNFFAKLGMCYFRIAESSGDPVLMVEYGEQFVALPLPGLRRELNLEENAPDAKMLELVVKGLKFVTTLAIGDPLPSEIISGKPSWALTPQHAQIAYQRLAMKLMAWMTGVKTEPSSAISTGEEILKQFEDHEVRKKIAAAFDEAAEALGLGRDRREDVVTYLETLAQELGYIEALREKFSRVVRVGRRLKEMASVAKKGQRVADVITQGAQLMRPAVEQFVGLFKDADAVTADILGALKNLDGAIAEIRGHRDEIYQRLIPWTDLLEAWEKCTDNDIGSVTVDLAARTVRMLAPRFMPSKEWVLRFKEDKQKKGVVKSWRSPDQQRADMQKVLGATMRW
jgi:hypothetical protein